MSCEENLNGKLHFWAVNGSTEVNNACEKDCCKDSARLQQTSRMESFAKLSILDSCEGPRYPPWTDNYLYCEYKNQKSLHYEITVYVVTIVTNPLK